MSKSAQIDIGFRSARGGDRPDPERPFSILVIGDFSGRQNRGVREPLAVRRALSVDVDNLEDRLAEAGTAIYLPPPAGGEPQEVLFRTMDDFHPDQLFSRLPMFAEFRRLRGKLANPATFAAAAAEVRSWTAAAGAAAATAATAAPPAAAEPPPAGEQGADLLNQLLDKSAKPHAGPANVRSTDARIRDLVKSLVTPHTVPAPDVHRDEIVAAVDAAAGATMRALLHQPDFLAVEAAWRGLEFLLQRLELDENLQLHILDVSRAELEADLLAGGDVTETGLHRILAQDAGRRGNPGPWPVVATLYTFGAQDADLHLLARLAAVAQGANTTLLGNFDQAQAGAIGEDGPTTAAWRECCHAAGARHVGLATPRFMLRLPYGKATDAIAAFDFEEIPGRPGPEDYLWGYPSVACACLLGQAFTESGWALRPGQIAELDGLPMHVFKTKGDRELTPCAERWLSELDAEELIGSGLMPLLSIKGRDAVRVASFQSIAGDSLPLGAT